MCPGKQRKKDVGTRSEMRYSDLKEQNLIPSLGAWGNMELALPWWEPETVSSPVSGPPHAFIAPDCAPDSLGKFCLLLQVGSIPPFSGQPEPQPCY